MVDFWWGLPHTHFKLFPSGSCKYLIMMIIKWL
jgi:hypothetical protein